MEIKGGYTAAVRYVVRSADTSAFVKIATTPLTAAMLRREIHAYGILSGVACCTRLMGWQDDDRNPLLVIEDLSGAYWPPPWNDARVAAVLDAIEGMHALKADLPVYAAVHGGREPCWKTVAAAPTPFLSLGLVNEDWLMRSLPALIEAEDACATEGTAVTHWDLRSDNMCFVGGHAKFIDWAEACLSNPKLDLGFWLPSLCFEGGPAPDDILPASPEVAAWVSGFFAASAGLPTIPDAPFVRRVQREQLSTALPWVVRALKLPGIG